MSHILFNNKNKKKEEEKCDPLARRRQRVPDQAHEQDLLNGGPPCPDILFRRQGVAGGDRDP